MASNLVEFLTALLAGFIVGIVYDQSLVPHVSALSSIVPDGYQDKLEPRRLDSLDVEPKESAATLRDLSKYGLPSTDNLRVFNEFVLSYDRRLRGPVWVMEHLTPTKLAKDDEAQRNRSSFREDKQIHEYFRAHNSDYEKSGYDRGHMAAAGNHKLDQDDLDQTFILSNISPQAPKFNRGGWERLEAYVRHTAKRSRNLYVVSGPLYMPMKARDGNLYVTYRVIGKNHVSVPTHYFKVFLVEPRDSDRLAMEAFLMPNDNKLDDSVDLNDYRVTIDRLDQVERSAGVIFFDRVPRGRLETPRSLVSDFKDEPRGASREHKRERDREGRGRTLAYEDVD